MKGIRVKLLLPIFFVEYLFCGKCNAQNDGLPHPFQSVLSETINAVNGNGASSNPFIFITDTHVRANGMQSPDLIKQIVEHTNINKVIWGGDAICAFGEDAEIERSWHRQLLLDSTVTDICNVYKIRGNHDFTIKESRSSDKGITYSQCKTAQMLLNGRPDNIVLNTSDQGACYYFFDDKESHLRFIAFDTTDSIKGESVAWGTIYGVHDRQLQWIADSAIATIPKGYDIVFLSHVPFTDTTGARYKELSNVREIVDAAAKRTAGRVGNVYYDFTNLRKTSVLMCLSGHNHQDMQTYRNGVVHIVTASDAPYNDYRADPFVKDLSGRAKGSKNEVCFDCVSINKKRKLISAYRVGIGGDRFFHTKALKLKVGKSKHLKTSLNSPVEWRCYNVSGNRYNGKWTLYNDVVDIDDHGTVVCKKQGEAVALAIDEMGNKEFYNIVVR
jgi:hypothetical protein